MRIFGIIIHSQNDIFCLLRFFQFSYRCHRLERLNGLVLSAVLPVYGICNSCLPCLPVFLQLAYSGHRALLWTYNDPLIHHVATFSHTKYMNFTPSLTSFAALCGFGAIHSRGDIFSINCYITARREQI